MSANVVNQTSYLRTTRNFPDSDIKLLTVEINRTYVDIANAVNNRTISIFTTNRPVVNGESWFIISNRQQAFRQVYTFTSNADIDIGFKINSIFGFSRCYGQFTDGINWYGVIFGSNVAIAGQLSFFIAATASPTNDVIRFLTGAGAPAIVSGIIVLEWLSPQNRASVIP